MYQDTDRRFAPHAILGDTIYEGNNKACTQCGSVEFSISEGRGPHRAGLYCFHCEQFNGWLSAVTVAELIETLAEKEQQA